MLRIDLLILPLLTLAYGLQYYDKAVLGSATLFGILKDLDLTPARYSQANACFYYGYLAGAMPCAWACLRFRRHLNLFLGSCVVLWGAVVMMTPLVRDWRGLYAQRVFLGFIEASVSPGFVAITRIWYTKQEQPIRLGIWYSATGLFSIFSGLVNRRLGAVETSLAPWKLIFLVPGAITVFFGILLLLILPPSPLRPPILRIKGYNALPHTVLQMTHEKITADHGDGESAGWSWNQAREAVLDVKIWGFLLMATAIYIVNGSVTVFGPLLVKSIGYTSLQATLLLTPGGATTCIAIYLFALLATPPRLARIPYARTGLLVLSCLPPIIGACMCWKGDWGNKAVPLAGYYLLPTFGAPFVLLLGWSTANVKGGTKQAIASGAIFVGYNLGNIASSYILLAQEAENHYPTTFKTVIGVMGATVAITLFLAFVMARENARRDASKRARRNDGSMMGEVREGDEKAVGLSGAEDDEVRGDHPVFNAMSSPKRRTDTDVMKLLMSDFDVNLVNDSMSEFYVKFKGPTETPFEGGVWSIHVELPEQYPYKSPSIGFMNKIFHPNIDEQSGSVCLDVINQTWSPMYELINIFESFLPQLLRYPNAADPLNGEAAALFMRSPDEYARKVREHVKRYAGAKDAQDALEGGGEAEHGASEEDEDEDGEMSDMGEMSDDEAAGAMDM
ncbi:hypothetical protein NliqN6_5828 [Naganishia liquefaciens]|uniref:MFS transporter n=1 Tax=Naganishia liquefaciens TaxID=104408 RepID=A0A8H3YJD5_9TREE|nr:hypothetical protein NliqN6_5828 [Naganishia liquefaciens]